MNIKELLQDPGKLSIAIDGLMADVGKHMDTLTEE